MTEDSADLRLLVERAQGGDRHAFRGIVGRYQARVFNLALLMVRDRDLADDLAQDAFVRIYQSLDTFKFQASFETWLHSVVRNLWIDRQRATRRLLRGLERLRRVGPPEGAGSNPERILLEKERSHQVRAALATLKPRHREILLLRYAADLDCRQIGSVLGCSIGTVCSRLSRALRQFQEVLQASGRSPIES